MNRKIEASNSNSEVYCKFRAMDDVVIGEVEAFIPKDKPWEMTLFWIIAYENLRGVGTDLFENAILWGKKNGATDVFADIIQDQFTEQRILWFKNRGMTIIDGYTAVGGVDHIIEVLNTNRG